MKKYSPRSPGLRTRVSLPYRELLSGDKPSKKLTKGGVSKGGRNARGRITVRHQGGGHKRKYRMIDFVFDKKNIPAKVETIEYDPYRTGFIALVCYMDGERRYILAPKSVQVGATIMTGEDAPLAPGNRLPVRKIPVGTFVFNLSLRPDAKARLARSAGVYAQVMAHDAGYAQIKLPSSEIRKVPGESWATIGEVSNPDHHLVSLGKAGRSRWMGIRPTVRGTAMNPVDHPHGGGEGKAPRGRKRAVSMWGKPTGKGQKSRKAKKYSNTFIVERRKVGKKR